FVIAPSVLVPVITTGNYLSVRSGESINVQILATNDPASFNVSPLPPGVSLDLQSGLLSGVLSEVGTHTFTLSANNAHGTGPQVEFTLEVLPALTTFAGWASTLPPGQQGPLDEPFGDGIPN